MVLETMHPFKLMASPPFTHNLLFDAVFSNANVKVDVINIKSLLLLFLSFAVHKKTAILQALLTVWAEKKSKTSTGLGKKVIFTHKIRSEDVALRKTKCYRLVSFIFVSDQ